jgi:outer membrane murein-binding lipoprotein Lpp
MDSGTVDKPSSSVARIQNVAQTAMDQQQQADQADAAQRAAGDHGQHLLLRGRHAQGMDDLGRRQHAEEVPEEQADDAQVEQVGARPQGTGGQHLAGLAAPGVLVAVEARQAAQQEDGPANVRVDAKDELMCEAHAAAPLFCCAPCAWRRTI